MKTNYAFMVVFSVLAVGNFHNFIVLASTSDLFLGIFASVCLITAAVCVGMACSYAEGIKMDIVEREMRNAMFKAIRDKDEARAVEMETRLNEYRSDHK